MKEYTAPTVRISNFSTDEDIAQIPLGSGAGLTTIPHAKQDFADFDETSEPEAPTKEAWE